MRADIITRSTGDGQSWGTPEKISIRLKHFGPHSSLSVMSVISLRRSQWVSDGRLAMMESAAHGATSLCGEPAIPVPLIQAAAAGHAPAFETLYRQHLGAVYALCLRMTGQREAAEDYTQETFVAAWRALPQFAARSSFATWLHRIAVNQVLARHRGPDSYNQRAASTTHEIPEIDTPMTDTAPPLDLERAIAALPEAARHVLVLVGIYGHSHDEAAELLGIAAGTCRAHLHRARQLLSARLGLGATNDRTEVSP
jgi:RNA polymerase sigma-70 factor (ECF subfamily)